MIKNFDRDPIKEKLFWYGIDLDIESGLITYNKKSDNCILKSNSLWFMRHGQTIASEKNQFMSTYSDNSKLSKSGINTVEKNINYLKNISVDVVLYSPLPRVVETVNIIKEYLPNHKFECLDFLIGIDNASWSGKKFVEFTNQEKSDYISRECYHNVFAKAKGGNCWCDVLINCIEFVKLINDNYMNKDVLLVSQESILWGIKIITHSQKTPWCNYDAKKMFNLKCGNLNNTYGKLLKIQ